MNKPSPPAAPDYQSIAQQQGQQSIELAKMQNPNVVGPYGTQSVTYGGTPDQTLENFDSEAFLKANPGVAAEVARGGQPYFDANGNYIQPVKSAWDYWERYGKTSGDQFTYKQGATGNIPTITQQLSPAQQGLLDQQTEIQGLLGGLAKQGVGGLQGLVGTRLNMSGLPRQGQTPETPSVRASDLRQKVMDAMLGRVNEDYGRDKDQLNSDLVAAGLRPGTKAYDDRMALLDRGLTDARNQAYLSSGQEMSREFGIDAQRFGMDAQRFGMDNQLRAQSLAELLTERQTPLNEISRLLGGSEVTNPFVMPGYSPTQASGTPYMQAAQLGSNYASDLYNAQAAQAGGVNSGLFGLGTAGITAAAIIAA